MPTIAARIGRILELLPGVLQNPFLPRRGRISWFEIALFAGCAAWVALDLAPALQDVAVLTFLFAGLALAWNIAGGYAGLISFGHAAFFGVGAYASTILLLQYDLTPWLGIFAGAAAAALAGAVLALICARLKGPFFILSTLAFAEVVRIVALNWSSLTGGPEGLSISPAPDFAGMVLASKQGYAVLMLGYMALVYAIARGLEASRFGFYLLAVRDNDDAAAAAGIDPLAVRTAAMALSAALTGMGGTLFAQYFLYLDPTYVISPELSFQFALLPAVGGLGTAVGPILGSLLITPLSELLRSSFGSAAAGLHLVIYSLGLIIIMLYFPTGLAGALAKLKPKRKRMLLDARSD
jgi:branched-chain amino acid transport system permease protein